MERYAAAACQVDFENPRDRAGIRGHADRMIATIRQIVEGYAPFHDGRILAQADPGPGEKVVVSEIDLTALRAARERRRGHDLLHHLRTELYDRYREPIYPAGTMTGREDHTVEDQEERMREARRRRKEGGGG